MKRWLLLSLFCAVTLLSASASSAANSVTLEVLDASGVEDPVEDIGRTFVLAGHVDKETNLYVKYRAAGGAPCAPSAASDSGDALEYWYDVDGNFRVSTARAWDEAGGFLFCMWLADSSYDVALPFSRTVTFRVPNGSVSLSTIPATLKVGLPGTLTVTGVSEAPREVYVKYRRSGGAACAPTPSSDSGDSASWYGDDVNGAFSLQDVITIEGPGSYLFCVWLRRYSSDVEATGGTPAAFIVQVSAPAQTPPPPPSPPPVLRRCKVPSVVGHSLPVARGLLRTGGCSVGRIRRVRSVWPRGLVIRQRPRVGTRLARGAPVNLVLSRGR